MKRLYHIPLIVLLMLAVLIMPARAYPAHIAISVVDDHGTSLTLATPPQRIISLAPNVTEILFALGLGSRVVGVSSYSNYPPAASRIPQVINYTALNLEKIVGLKPDLLVAAAIVPQAAIDKLRALHLPVLMTDPHDLNGILKDISMVGIATGVPAKAAALVASMQARIAAVKAEVRKATTHPRVFYELDSTLYTVGHGSFIDALITLAGGTNVAGGIMNPYPQLSAEKLISADPQYIILGDAAYGVTAAKVAARPGWAGLSAVKYHHVVPFNDDLGSRPGPRIVQGLDILARIIHPELFR